VDYNNILKNVVLPKLKEFGRPLKLIFNQSASGDWEKFYDTTAMKYRWKNNDTGETADVPPQDVSIEQTVNGLVDTFRTREIDNTFIKAGDLRIYIEPTVEPHINQTLEFDNKKYSIYHIDTLQPSTLVLMYTLYVRNS
jgi:hypothetical protein